MLDGNIKDGDIFIVFDLEWNQPLPGKEYGFDLSRLTGEIIEIGAVKLIYRDGRLLPVDLFSRDIKPVCYTSMHFHVRKVTHKTDDDLRRGMNFLEAYEEFRAFCGEQFILAGWSNSDTDMLKMNLKYFGKDDKIGAYFIDVQPLFSLFTGQAGLQRSVEYAVDYYKIPKKETFHSATADAEYTAKIFAKIFEENPMLSVVNAIVRNAVNTDVKRDFTKVGPPCKTKEEALSCVKGFTERCPVCDLLFTAKLPPFMIRKSSYCLLNCGNDGDFFGRTRIKKNKHGKYYAASILRLATEQDLLIVRSKKEEYDRYGHTGAPRGINEQNVNKKCQKDVNKY